MQNNTCENDTRKIFVNAILKFIAVVVFGAMITGAVVVALLAYSTVATGKVLSG